MSELYKKHRPASFDNVIGQDEAVRSLSEFVKNNKIPHAILLTGPSGVGKTTLARILKDHLGCGDPDFQEINAADFRGIDTVREIRQRMGLAPMFGKSRVWLIDECHKLSNDAQSALLKILEDTPEHVWFFLCTTDPAKVIKTIHTRCTEIKLQALSLTDLKKLLQEVLLQEFGKEAREKFSGKMITRIAEVADGSARKALVLLNQVVDIQDEEERLEVIQKSDSRKAAFDLARALVWEKSTWEQVAQIISSLEDGEDWEGIRRLILSCAVKEVLKGSHRVRAARVLSKFQFNWFDTQKAGLVLACHDFFFTE